jgi:endonuclease/exonuclease/phosphatase family metal-dependent hydrolase
MTFVTFNIRCDYGQDGANSFCFRKPFVLLTVREKTPDIICFQEVLPHVAAWLKENLEDYYVVGCGRSDALEDEQVSIAYRKDRSNLIQMETFWLSETPDVPASRYPDQSNCPRVCTLVLLQDLKEKTVFRVVNTHLDHIGIAARRKGLEQILRRVESERFFAQAPVILVGDFNAEPDGEELLVFREFPGYVNAGGHRNHLPRLHAC